MTPNLNEENKELRQSKVIPEETPTSDMEKKGPLKNHEKGFSS
jgi:hypothetical protein